MRILRRWIAVYRDPAMSLLHEQALGEFDRYDQTYFSRTGLTEDAYVAWLVIELRRGALQRFQSEHGLSNGPASDTVDPDAPGTDGLNRAYARFEAAALRHHALAAARLPVKAYIARRLGLTT